MVLCRTFGILLTVFLLVGGVPGFALGVAPAAQPSSHTLVLDGLGKGAAALDGPWQFHLGDNPAWADPAYDDSHWEQITAGKPWGMQGHANYTGYAWYRRAMSITPAPGISPDMALLIPGILDVYQVYWNGVEVGHRGQMPPSLQIITGGPAQRYKLGPMQSGVLAVRVWSIPQPSNASEAAGGFIAVPQIGSVQAIEGVNNGLNYQWLRRQQFTFALTSLYTLVALLSLVAWLRDRKQWLFFWMTVFAFTPLAELFLAGTPYSLFSRPAEFRGADRDPNSGDLAVVPFALAATAARSGETGPVYAHRRFGCFVLRVLRWNPVPLLSVGSQ